MKYAFYFASVLMFSPAALWAADPDAEAAVAVALARQNCARIEALEKRVADLESADARGECACEDCPCGPDCRCPAGVCPDCPGCSGKGEPAPVVRLFRPEDKPAKAGTAPLPPRPAGEGWKFDPELRGKNGATGWYRILDGSPFGPARPAMAPAAPAFRPSFAPVPFTPSFGGCASGRCGSR